MNNLKEIKGWIVSVWQIAYGHYAYTASKGTEGKRGSVEATDEMEAFDSVSIILDW